MKGTGLQMHTASTLLAYFWWCKGGRKVTSLTGKCCQLFASTVCSVIKESRILNLAKLFVGVSTHWETSSLCECWTWSDNIAEILVTKDVQLDVLTELLFLQLERVFIWVFIFTITQCHTPAKIAEHHAGKIMYSLAWYYLESSNTFVCADHLLRGLACLINQMSTVVRCTEVLHFYVGFSSEYLDCLIYPGSSKAAYRKHLQSEVALTLACNTFTRLWWAFIFPWAVVAGCRCL